LIAKEKGTIKMMDGSTCKIIGIGIVKVTCGDETMRTLEAIQYVSEAWHNLISIGVLGKEGCQIYVQQGVVTVSQGDRVILKGENCGGIYKLKEENSVRDEVSEINLEGSPLRGGVLRKTTMGREPSQSVAGKRKKRIQTRHKYAQSLAVIQPKAPGRGARVKGFIIGYT